MLRSTLPSYHTPLILIEPVLDAAAAYPQQPAAFSVLSTLIHELSKTSLHTEAVLKASGVALQALLRILMKNSGCACPDIFKSLQSCISLLGTRLKVPAIDGIVEICLDSLYKNDYTSKIGALETLAVLVMIVLKTSQEKPQLQRNAAVLGDFLDIIALSGQRLLHFDTSEAVRAAAKSLLVSIDHCRDRTHPPVAKAEAIAASCVEIKAAFSVPNSHSAEEQEDIETKLRNSGSHSPLVAIALTPLSEFIRSIETEDTPMGMSPSANGNKKPLEPENCSHDAFSDIESDLESFGSTVEVEIEKFLRGSILPADWAVGLENQTGNNEKFSKGIALSDTASSGGELLPPVGHSEIGPKHLELLRRAFFEHFGEQIADISPIIDAADIEAILRKCLDMHSELLYEVNVQEAEAKLVRASQTLIGSLNADDALEMHAKVLEQDVHRIVAEQQAEFMEDIVPLLADVLADSGTLQEYLTAVVV